MEPQPTAPAPSFPNTSAAFFAPIVKIDRAKRMVYSFASTPTFDSQKEEVALEAMKNALASYMDFPVVKEMHRMETAAGVTKSAEEIEKDGKHGTYVGIKVVDDAAWIKVEEGVYRGLSIGGRVKKRVGNKITELELREISLVDRPANPDCVFDVVKIDDAPAVPDPIVAAPVTVVPPVTPTPEVKPTMLKSDTIASLTKNIYAAHMALEAMSNLASARNSVEYNEKNGDAAYAGMTESMNGAMTELGGCLKELLAAAIAALIPAEGDGAGGDVAMMDQATTDRLTKARDALSASLAKMNEALTPAAAPAALDPVVPAPAVPPAPAAPAPVEAPVPAAPAAPAAPDAPLGKVDALEATVAKLSADVARLSGQPAPARTVANGHVVVAKVDDLPADVQSKVEDLAKKAEAANDPRTLIKLAQTGTLKP